MKRVVVFLSALMVALGMVLIPAAPANAACANGKTGERGFRHGIVHWQSKSSYVRVWFENPSYTKFLYGSSMESSVGVGYDYVTVVPRREDRTKDLAVRVSHRSGNCWSIRIGVGSGRSLAPYNPPVSFYTLTVTKP